MPRLFVTSAYGQLGNQLLLFANLIAYSCETGASITNPPFSPYAAMFAGTQGTSLCTYPRKAEVPRATAKWARVLSRCNRAVLRRAGISAIRAEWPHRIYLGTPAFLELVDGAHTVFLRGWGFRSGQELLEAHASEIRRFFRPVPEIIEANRPLLARVREQGDVVIGVHIRRGDYSTHLGGRYFFEFAQYEFVMRQLVALFPGKSVCFLIVSDGEVEHRFHDLRLTVRRGRAVEDLFLLAECDWVLGPPSTFTLSACFLGQTPLYSITNPHRLPSLRDFRIPPQTSDREVADLYC